MESIISAVRRRPVRVVESVVALVALVGTISIVVVGPEAENIVYAVIGLLTATGVIGGEVAQTQTRPVTEAASIPDRHEDADSEGELV